MNYDKVCYMVFGNISQELSLVMNKCPLKRVDHVKILGCIIDDKLNWKKQRNHVSRKCFLSLSPLYSLRYTLSQKSRLNIVTATVLSKLYYAPCVWFNANKGIRCKINNIIRTCARYIMGKSKYDSISSEISNELEWLNCDYRFKFECLKLAYLILNKICPNSFKDYVSIDNIPSITTRKSVHYPTGPKSLQQTLAIKWLKLPIDVRMVNSFPVFKCKVFKHLLGLQKHDILIMDENICDYSCIESAISGC